MNQTEVIFVSLKNLVEELVDEKYKEILSQGKNGRLTVDEIRNALREYGGKLTFPEEEDYSRANIIQMSDTSTYVVEYELWVNCKKSDLTLSCTVSFDKQNNANIYIDDIHVL